MTPVYTHTGKQVLRDGQHIADAIDPEAAAEIVSAMSAPDTIASYLDDTAGKFPRARTRSNTLRVAASNIRARLWERGD